MRICAPWSVSAVHLFRGRGFSSSVLPSNGRGSRRGDGSFEYQFLIDNTVYRYFKFTLSAMAIILQFRYFVSVLARDARYCKAQFCKSMSSVHACVRPSVTFVDQDHIGCKSTSGVGKGTNFKFCTHSHGIDRNKSPLKMSGKLDGRSYAGTPKKFQSML